VGLGMGTINKEGEGNLDKSPKTRGKVFSQEECEEVLRGILGGGPTAPREA